MNNSHSISKYLNIRSASSPKFFPDGKHIGFLTNITGIPQIWKAKVGKEPFWPEQLTFKSERVQWFICSSVQGDDRILFGRDMGGNENAQIFLLDGSKEIHLSKGFENARHIPGEWSRDGEKLLFSANRERSGVFDIYIQHFEGDSELVWRNDSPGYPTGLTFSPDGSKVTFSRIEGSFQHRLLELNIRTQTVCELSSSELARYYLLGYSKDGQSIIVTTDIGSDFLYVGKLNLETLEVKTLVDAEWDAIGLAVSPDGRLLAYAVNEAGISRLAILDMISRESRWIDLGKVPGVIPVMGYGDSPVFSPTSNILAFPFTSATSTTDIYTLDIQRAVVNRVTCSSNGGLMPESFIPPRLIHYPSFDHDRNGKVRMIPAWFYKPNKTKGKAPAMVIVHGGPEGQSRPTFDFRIQYFLQKGYAVFVPNVRGSTGYGKAYSHLDDVRKRMDSVADLAHGALWLKEQPEIDANRLIVMGGSYGGFMVLSAVTAYPDLWAMGIDIVGISNLATFLKNTSDYRRRHREAEYGSLAHDYDFLESIAPINHIEKIKVPLMVIQGANDPRVPMSESDQMVEALRELGKTVDYLVFDNEGHGIFRLENKKVAYTAIVEFFNKHLDAKSDAQ
jgi:dipeptidyl aminopeptidase/acylaminoacyl peptidase